MNSSPTPGSGFGRFPEPDRPVPPADHRTRTPAAQRAPRPAQHNAPAPNAPAGDFTTPVELRCVLQPDTEIRRAVPLLIFTFLFAALVVAVVIGVAAPDAPAVGIVCGLVAGAAASGAMYARMKSRLTRTYGQLQRLLLTPRGLQRTDGTVVNDMPWATMTRIEVRNSALPGRRANVLRSGVAGAGANVAIGAAHTKIAAGIVGRSTLTPLPGANRTQLKVHDQTAGGRSNLSGGQPFVAEQGLIFPGEFETDWTRGVVGAWLRHYRPDLQLPA
ncbi:hypothetical protein [Gordonia neofelifaecis]|uniref:Uncharacterized protein n=1 Tax=Gordonia neofelifaecis NRRL B-59395 TaxID=644548 RepID=F1YHR7_9ACTN|nr:hypothetical protein [Gordonia neofelifaecis]EGD55905.1 hypothetical protein SCNU_06675 [Gordonia neofelifaecis NRRL B-59395]